MDKNKQKASKRQVNGNHYLNAKVSSLDFVMKNEMNYLQGCVIKYIYRYKMKNGKEDLEKAIHCIELLMEYEYGDDNEK